MLIYMITLNELLGFDGFLENIIQLGWLGTSTKLLFFLLDELKINYIIDQGSS